MQRYPVMIGIVWVAMVGLSIPHSVAAESTVGTEKIVKEARETIEATREYTAQQKEAIEQKMREELTVFQRHIVELREKVTQASDSTRVELQKSLNELERRKDGVKEQLDELKSTTDAKWHEVQEAMTTTLNELKQSYQKLVSHLP